MTKRFMSDGDLTLLFDDSLLRYKRSAVQAAKDLCYPRAAIKAIKSATSESQICRIMTNCRRECFV